MFRIISVGLSGLLLAGCVANTSWGLPQISLAESPDNPAVVSQESDYRSVIGSYTPRVPSEPRRFRDTGVEIEPVTGSTPTPSEGTTSPEAKPLAAPNEDMAGMNHAGSVTGGSAQ
jgi:hypothetical protein